ncbi:oxidoreductase [Cutibacterium acnes JCM 18916]|nr:oxidoreductase [Cutibacterium acnes JCM 18916]
MRMRTVGASGLKVSAIGLGSLTWGGQTDARKVRSLVRRFVDAGGNLVDTAPAYGAGSPNNSSESSPIPISVEMTLS